MNFTHGVHNVNIKGVTVPKNPYHHGDLRNALVLTAVRLIEDDPETVAAIGEFLDCCRENGWTVTQDKIATVFGPAVQVTEWEPVDDDE